MTPPPFRRLFKRFWCLGGGRRETLPFLPFFIGETTRNGTIRANFDISRHHQKSEPISSSTLIFSRASSGVRHCVALRLADPDRPSARRQLSDRTERHLSRAVDAAQRRVAAARRLHRPKPRGTVLAVRVLLHLRVLADLRALLRFCFGQVSELVITVDGERCLLFRDYFKFSN